MAHTNEDLERMRRNLSITDEELIQYPNEKGLDYYVFIDFHGATIKKHVDKIENLHNKTFREILNIMYNENNYDLRHKDKARSFYDADKKHTLEWIKCKVGDEVVNVSENEKAGPYMEEDKTYKIYLCISYLNTRLVPDEHP